jgi:hypothetical protein
MKLAVAGLFLVVASALAHPGIGVVADSRGNVFYTDLHHVWRIAPDGSKSIAVANVHTHELFVDAGDNLYGEHLWYNGEKLDTWGSRVWRRSPEGRVVDIVPAHAGFNDYSFVRDAAGNSYFAVREKSEIRERTPAGKMITIARGNFHDMRWMTVTPDGIVYLIDRVDLIRVTPDGRITTIARNLSDAQWLRAWVGSRHRLMGLWVDGAGNVYIADHAGGNVKRVDRGGRVSVVARSTYPWGPTGGAFDRAGNMWLLEYAVNDARVRKIVTAPSRRSGLASAGR